MTQVTEAYLLGIKEGRNHLNNFPELINDIETMQTIAYSSTVLAKNSSGEMKEFHKGDRDFWRNQIKKAKGQ